LTKKINFKIFKRIIFNEQKKTDYLFRVRKYSNVACMSFLHVCGPHAKDMQSARGELQTQI
jgi:hypothetical protein